MPAELETTIATEDEERFTVAEDEATFFADDEVAVFVDDEDAFFTEDELAATFFEELLLPLLDTGSAAEENESSTSTHSPLLQTRGFLLSTGLMTKPSLASSQKISNPFGFFASDFSSAFALLALSSPHAARTRPEQSRYFINFFIGNPSNTNFIYTLD